MRGQNTHKFRQPRQRSLTLRHAADEGVSSKELTLDFEKRIVTVGGKLVHLTPKEFDLLRQLVEDHRSPVAHRQLWKAAWGPHYGGEMESLRVVVNQLRKKIESDPA